jgi:hypothetical protein
MHQKSHEKNESMEAFMFSDNCLNNLEEKGWEKRRSKLYNIIIKELLEENISRNVDIDAQKLLE